MTLVFEIAPGEKLFTDKDAEGENLMLQKLFIISNPHFYNVCFGLSRRYPAAYIVIFFLNQLYLPYDSNLNSELVKDNI